MNFASILYILGTLMEVEGALFLAPAVVSLFYRESEGLVYFGIALICALIGRLVTLKKVSKPLYYAKEGFISVAMGWIIMSVVGCIPFVLTGEIPDFINALFETVSGFTTTGSSILSDVESMSHCSLFWRSFSHWIGGMGVFVFILAILPKTGAQNMHLLRSESPGPDVGKLVPKLGDSAKILYIIYFGMTVIQMVILLITGMPLFDSITLTFGTAGTGGFGIKNSSIADYTYLQQMIISVFMLLFGVNFNFYFFILVRHSIREAFSMEEVRAYFAVVIASTLIIMHNARGMFASPSDAFGKALFQVST